MNAPLFWSIAWPVTPTESSDRSHATVPAISLGLAHAAKRHLLLRDLPRLLLGQPLEQREPEPGHVGVDPAGADRVHLDPPRRELGREGAHRARAARPSTRSTPV